MPPKTSLQMTAPQVSTAICYRCGCEVLVLPSGISVGRKPCPEAERLHDTQARLSTRLMSVPQGTDTEHKLIATIEEISDILVSHRKEADAGHD